MFLARLLSRVKSSEILVNGPTRHAVQLVSACVKTVCIAHVVYEYAYCVQPTVGASMLPTIQVMGDHVLISRAYRRGRGVKVGDVVSFASVIKPRERVIKRIIGMPGDFVLRDTPGKSHDQRMIQVPEGHCWVTGDNLEYSRDSRHYGPVPLALVYGKVLATVFPWKERRWIENGLQPAS
ncbi:unnamed protein product [Blumeria hordei]|uniref:Peptidase S26 domain-containing protein n=1 Tax=Blumeria hordei TaxID=2867405 RepID=A0A383USZ5_BLUHO|nr:unnamed protein product [Blumeria hordei]